MEKYVSRRLSTGDHSHCRRPPLRPNSLRHEQNRAIETLVHAVADYFRAPGSRIEDLVQRLRVRGAMGWPLLNQHVQLSPHHIDEQLDSAGFHQVSKQLR